MGVKEDIDALEARSDLTPDEKRAQRYALKTAAFLPILQGRIGQSITRNGITVTLLSAFEVVENGASWLGLSLSATGPSGEIPINNPILIREPPIEDGTPSKLATIAEQLLTIAVPGWR